MLNWLRGLQTKLSTKPGYAKLKVFKPPTIEELRKLREEHIKLILQGDFTVDEKHMYKVAKLLDNEVTSFKLLETTVDTGFDDLESAELDTKQSVEKTVGYLTLRKLFG